MTNGERRRLHIGATAVCSRCTGEEESVMHAVRDCEQAKEV